MEFKSYVKENYPYFISVLVIVYRIMVWEGRSFNPLNWSGGAIYFFFVCTFIALFAFIDFYNEIYNAK